MHCESNAGALTTKLQALQSRADKAQGKSSAQKHRHHTDTLRHQDRKNCNTRVSAKYSNCDKKMAIRNGRQRDEGKRKYGCGGLNQSACMRKLPV